MRRLDGRGASLLSETDGSGYDEVVATLSLLAPSTTGQKVLVGVRSDRPSAHRDVMSLPTLRLPRLTAEPVLADPRRYTQWAGMTAHHHSEHVLIFLCRSIMALKLGLADWVVAEQVEYRCRLGTVLVGETAVDETVDPPLTQRIAMLNLVCEVAAAPPVPSRTVGYSSLKWVAVPAFLEAVRRRDASIASPEWDCISVCVRGLCVEVGARDLGAVLALSPARR